MSEQISLKDAVNECHKRGFLSWKLKPEQKRIYDMIHACKVQKFVINSSRRLGKSYLLCLLADEYARRHPDSVIKYCAPTQKQVRDIIKPIFGRLWRDCAQELVPRFLTMDSCFIYPNGSKISVVGCDMGRIDRLRGDSCNLALIDEAGMIDASLHYIISDIILPQTLTVPKIENIDRKIILASTPPISPSHPFVSYVAEAEGSKDNNYIKMTIHDNSLLDKQTILDYAVESGCVVENGVITKFSTTFRREYMAEVITDASSAVCPEFDEATQAAIITETERPPYFDCYVSMDPGLVDLTAILFAHWDFTQGLLIIEDEIILNYKDGLNTEVIASAIKEKEKELWGPHKPYLRIMDNSSILCQDLNDLHQLNFFPTDKDNKEAAVNAMRLMVHNKTLRINPRCTGLVSHLKYAVWNRARTKFERSGELGHFDPVDALIYLVRNIDRSKNPFPSDYNAPHYGDHHIPPPEKKTSQSERVYIDLLKSPTKEKPYEDIFLNWMDRRSGGKF